MNLSLRQEKEEPAPLVKSAVDLAHELEVQEKPRTRFSEILAADFNPGIVRAFQKLTHDPHIGSAADQQLAQNTLWRIGRANQQVLAV